MNSAMLPRALRAVSTRRTATISNAEKPKTSKTVPNAKDGGIFDLGPIGMTVGPDADSKSSRKPRVEDGGVFELGPIGMTIGKDKESNRGGSEEDDGRKDVSISTISTDEWRKRYENNDGSVSLWVEEEFNAGSRLIGGRAVHLGRPGGLMTGEGPSLGAPTFKISISNHYQENRVFELEVPSDRYILYEAEDQGLELPYACRMGCCTACAVRIKSGTLEQPEALGISMELKQQGYALMCVGFPTSDLVLETVTEDEIYDLQFGAIFQERALDPNDKEKIDRDDLALEVIME